MTDDELRELRQLLLTTSAFGMKAAMVKWISSVLERRLAAQMALSKTVPQQPVVTKPVETRRLAERRRDAKASIAITRSGFRKGG